MQAEKGGRLGEVLVGDEAAAPRKTCCERSPLQLDLPYLGAILSIDESTPELIKRMPINFAKQNELSRCRRGRRRRRAGRRGSARHRHRWTTRGCCWSRDVMPRSRSAQRNRRRDQPGLRPRRQRGRTGSSTRWKRRISTAAGHELEEPQDLLDSRRRSADHPVGQLAAVPGGRRSGPRDIHIEPFETRAVGPLPHRRRAARDHQAAQALPGRASSAASRSWRSSTSPRSACRRTAAFAIKIAGRDIDIRVSTIPMSTARASSCVCSTRRPVLLDLGRARHAAATSSRCIDAADPPQPHGIVLVTGPTGSRQDHDALRRARRDQHARPQDHHRRGPGRVPARRASARCRSTPRSA